MARWMIYEANHLSSARNPHLSNPRRDRIAPVGTCYCSTLMPDEKDFAGWFAHQIELERGGPPRRGFTEGEVWRCALGHNVGHELDGRSRRYWRPVLVLRKLSPAHLLGVPLTGSANQQPFRVPLMFRGKKGYAALDQVRSLDARRLQQRLGALSPEELRLIREELIALVQSAE